MDRLKRARRPLRKQLTTLVNKINQELEEETPNKNHLRIDWDLLENVKRELHECDENIKDKMLDEEVGEEDQDREFEEIMSYDLKFTTVKKALEDLLDAPYRGSPPSSEFGTASSDPGSRKTIKLPKIELPKFNGEIKDWLGFWSQFCKIHENTELHDSDKFTYLVQATVEGSRARELVLSYPQSSANYPKVVKALKDRFGKDELLVEVYVRELLKLVVHNASQAKEQIDLSKLYDQLEAHLRRLESLQVTSDKYDAMLYPMVESCLPISVLRAWQRGSTWKQCSSTKTKLSCLMEFLATEVEGEQRIKLAREGFVMSSEATESGKQREKGVKSKGRRESNDSTPTAIGLHSAEVKRTCGFCDKNHETQDCFAAQGWSLEARKKKLQDNKRCYTCLKPIGGRHVSSNCGQQLKCLICGNKHYVILCPDLCKRNNLDGGSNSKTSDGDVADGTTIMSGHNQTCVNEVVLQTLVVRVRGNGKSKLVRVLIDTGSQHSYVLKKLAMEMDYKPTGEAKFTHSLFGGSTVVDKSHKRYQVKLESIERGFHCILAVYDQEKICGGIPRISDRSWIKELQDNNIQVCDFGPGSPEIEILIGADIIGKLLTGKLYQLSCGLTAVETSLGWSVMGIAPAPKMTSSCVNVTVLSMLAQSSMTDLWELDKIGINDPCEKQSKQELDHEAYEYFRQTVSREKDGRYRIRLPWLEGHPPLPSNKFIAEKRLLVATRKLKQSGKYADYEHVFDEWLQSGIIEEVPVQDMGKDCHYMPHLPVFKPESSTTKVRPVFDASCHAENSPSLNQCLAKGPNLLELIPALLLKFRKKPVAATADIRKAFLMITVDDEDCDFLRFLWWESESSEKQKIYRHRRVVFGVNASPFLLGAVLELHLSTVPEKLKTVAEKLSQSLYVDNVVASFDDEEQYHKFKLESTKILEHAKFDLRMWESNVDTEVKSTTSVLGVKWDRESDTIFCHVEVEKKPEKLTKKYILSVVAQIFDPLGVLSPVTLIPKLCLQEAWKNNLKWEDEVDGETAKKFGAWREELEIVNMIKIPRYAAMGESSEEKWTIHTFCDASTKGYAAATFLRCGGDEEATVQLMMAKARVAPLKDITVNRLELISCEIGARLCNTVVKAMKLEKVLRYYWTDSSTALSWIKRNDQWGTFVGNRVNKILKLTKPEEWSHVPGHMNPADLPSRGCGAHALLESKWWEGPSWLPNKTEWPSMPYKINENEVLLERKKAVVATMSNMDNCELPWYSPKKSRISKFSGLVRVMAYAMRFIYKCRKFPVKTETLNAEEIEVAERKLLLQLQREVFAKKEEFNVKVIKDSEGLLRVQTKITMREDSAGFRFPILLPGKHSLVEAIIRKEHLQNCHAGTQFLMSKLRESYWIIKGRKTVDRVVSRCVRCRRFRSKHAEPECAPLPSNRVRDANPYEVTGIDYLGPLFLKDGTKVWVALYTCAVVRAVHLELVSGLSTEVFLMSLRRFISRCGRPVVVYTDNGTNFSSTSRLLARLDWKKIEEETSVHRMSWIHNVASAPWWGGFFERLVRSVKELLVRVLGSAVVDHEELATILCDVESVINQRPLTYVFENDEVIPLTPSMFLRGVREAGVPDIDHLESTGFQKRFRYRQRLMKDLKNRFRKEYLGLLIQKKSKKTEVPIRVGDIVLIGSENKKRIGWPLGQILDIVAGRDGIPRVAKLKTKHGILMRPFQRLYPLEVKSEDMSVSMKNSPGDEERECIANDDGRTRTSYGRLVKKPERFSFV